MGTKVTKEEVEMLFASCGYNVVDVLDGKYFYHVKVKEEEIVLSDLESLRIEGLELYSIGIDARDRVEVSYYKE